MIAKPHECLLMPIYEYECATCGARAEIIHAMSDDSKRKCEKCGGKLERLISPSAFHLKGGGWYKDLYSKPAGPADSKSATKSKGSKKRD